MSSTRRLQVAVFCLFFAGLLIYWFRLDSVAGNWRDDAWYIILAKGLASGHGFQLICTPRPATYFYPPVFPLLLAAVFRFNPVFPANLWILKSISVAASFVCATLVYFYARQRDCSQIVSWLIAALVLLSPIMLFIATSSVLSEPVFCVFVFGALLAHEHWTKTQRNPYLWLAALLSGIAFLTRVQGITLIVSVFAWCVWKRQTKQAFLYAAIVAIVLMPWFVYRHSVREVPSLLPGYSEQFWDRLATSDQKVTWRALPGRVFQNLSAIAAVDTGALFAPSLYRSANESGSEVLNVTTAPLSRDFIGSGLGSMGSPWQTNVISLAVSLVAFIGFAHVVRTRPSAAELFCVTFCAAVAVWPWPTMRLIFPLYPLLCLYLLAGVRSVSFRLRSFTSQSEAPARIVLATMLGLFLMDQAIYIAQVRGLWGAPVTPGFTRHFEQARAASEWVRDHTASTDVVTGTNLPQIYLYSGRKVDYCSGQACPAAGIHYSVYETLTRDVPASAVVYEPGGRVLVLSTDSISLR
jgi:hypothetical protein